MQHMQRGTWRMMPNAWMTSLGGLSTGILRVAGSRTRAQAGLECPSSAGLEVMVAFGVVLKRRCWVHAQRSARVHQQHPRQGPRAVLQRTCPFHTVSNMSRAWIGYPTTGLR